MGTQRCSPVADMKEMSLLFCFFVVFLLFLFNLNLPFDGAKFCIWHLCVIKITCQ